MCTFRQKYSKAPKTRLPSQSHICNSSGLWVAGSSQTSPGQVVGTSDVTVPQLHCSELGKEELCAVFFSFPSPLGLPDVLITGERERMIPPICLHSTQINLLTVVWRCDCPTETDAVESNHHPQSFSERVNSGNTGWDCCPREMLNLETIRHHHSERLPLLRGTGHSPSLSLEKPTGS